MIEAIIVCIYLVATLIVGLVGINRVKTVRDFAISNKKFSTVALTATTFATWIGGDNLVGTAEYIFDKGYVFLVIQCAFFIALAIHAYWIAPKITTDFSDKISLSEIMGELYGNVGQTLAGIATILFLIGYIAVQVRVMGYVCYFLLGISRDYSLVMGSLIVIMYSTFGGIRSVVRTDILQFFVLIIGVPLMGAFALDKAGGFESLIERLPAAHANVSNGRALWAICFFVFCAFPHFDPMITQRILMARNVKQAATSIFSAGLLFIPFFVVIAIIALCGLIIFPNGVPNMAFLNISHSLPPIIKGLAISGFLAVLMSTADSLLNVSAVAMRDVAAAIMPRKLNDRQELILCRLTTVAFSLISIFLASAFDKMIDLMLYFENFWAPIIMAPMILYMFNVRVSVKSYVIGVVVGFSSTVFYRYLVPKDFHSVSMLFGMCVTIVCMLALRGKESRTRIRELN